MDEEERLRKIEAGKEKLAAYLSKKRAAEQKDGKRKAEQDQQASSAGSSPSRSLEMVLQDNMGSRQDKQEDILQVLQLRVRDLEEIISGKTSSLEAALEEINVLKAENAIQRDAHHKLVINFQKGIAQRDALIEKLTNTVQETMQTRAALETEGEHLAQVVASLQNQLQITTDIVQGQQWPSAIKETLYIDLLNQKLALDVKLQNYESEIQSLQCRLQDKQHELKTLAAQLKQDKLSSELEIKSLKVQMDHLHSNYKNIIKEYNNSIGHQCSEYKEKLCHVMEIRNQKRYQSQEEGSMKEVMTLKNILFKLSLYVESNTCDKYEVVDILNELREIVEQKEVQSQQFHETVNFRELLSDALRTVDFLKQQFKIVLADLNLTKCDLKKCKDSYKRLQELQKQIAVHYKFSLNESLNVQTMYDNILPESNNGCDIQVSLNTFSFHEDQVSDLSLSEHCINKQDQFPDMLFACLSSVIMKLLKAKEDIRELDNEMIRSLNCKETLGKEKEDFDTSFDEHMSIFIDKFMDLSKAMDLNMKKEPTIVGEFCGIDSIHTEKNQLEAFGEKDEMSPALYFKVYAMTQSECNQHKTSIDKIEKKLDDSIRNTASILSDLSSLKDKCLKDIFQPLVATSDEHLKEIIIYKQLIDNLEVQVLELSNNEEGIYDKLQEAKNNWEKNQMEAAAFHSLFIDYKEIMERLQKHICSFEVQASSELIPESYWDLLKKSASCLHYYKNLTSHYNLQVNSLKKEITKKDSKICRYRTLLTEYQRNLEKYQMLFVADEHINKMLMNKLKSKEIVDLIEHMAVNLEEKREKVCRYQSDCNKKQTEGSITNEDQETKLEKGSEFLDLERGKHGREVNSYAEILLKYHEVLEHYWLQFKDENECLSSKDISDSLMLEDVQNLEEKQMLLERQVDKLKTDLLLSSHIISLFKIEKDALLHSYESEIKIYKDQLGQLLKNLQKSRESKEHLLQASLKSKDQEPREKSIEVLNKMIQDEIYNIKINSKPVTDLQKELQFVKTVKHSVACDTAHMQTVVCNECDFENANLMTIEELAVQYLKAQGIIAAKEEIQSALEKRINELEDANEKVNLMQEANTELLEAIVQYFKLYGLLAAKDEIEESLLEKVQQLENTLYNVLNVNREQYENVIATNDMGELDKIRNEVLSKCKELKNVKSIYKHEILDVISQNISEKGHYEGLHLQQEIQQQQPINISESFTNANIINSTNNIEAGEKSLTFSSSIVTAETEKYTDLCILSDYFINPENQHLMNENNSFSRFALKLLRHSRALEKERIELANTVKKCNLQLEAKGLGEHLHVEDQQNVRLQYKELSEIVYLKTKMNHLIHENAQYKNKTKALLYQNQICHETKASLQRELEAERKKTDEKLLKLLMNHCNIQLQNEKTNSVESLIKILDVKGKEIINLKEQLRSLHTALDESRIKLDVVKRDEGAQRTTIIFLKDQCRKLCDELKTSWKRNLEFKYKSDNSERKTFLKNTKNESDLSKSSVQKTASCTTEDTHKRDCIHEDLYSAMEEATAQIEALTNALSFVRSEYKKLSLEMEVHRNSVAEMEIQLSRNDNVVETLDKKIHQILQCNAIFPVEDKISFVQPKNEDQNSESFKKLQQENELLKHQLDELQRKQGDQEADLIDFKLKLEREIKIQMLNAQYWKLEVQAKQCEAYVERSLRIRDENDQATTGGSIYYGDWEEQIEKIQLQLEEVHQETLTAMRAHLEEQFSVREIELQEKFNSELLALKTNQLEQLSNLQKELEACRHKMEFLAMKGLNQHLGSWSIFENAEAKDLVETKEKFHLELEEILGSLDQKQSSIYGFLKERFETYCLHQIASALKVARESIKSLHCQEISALKCQHETEMSVMQTKLQIDGYEKVLKVQQKLHKKHKDEINNVTKHLEARILKMKHLYNPCAGSTLLSQIRKHTCVEYTLGLKKSVDIWIADFKQKLDKLNKKIEKDLSQGIHEETITITQLIESKEQMLVLATDLQNELTQSLGKCLEKIGSQIEAANFKLKRELEISNEAMEKAILQTKLEKVLKENEELIKSHKFAMEYQMSEHSRELAKLHAQIDDGTAVLALRHELEVKHNKEMEELRKYFEKKCAELEQNYSEEVFMKRKRKSSGSSSEEEFLTEMYSPQHLTPLTHICDSCSSEPNNKELKNIHVPDVGKQILECTYQLDAPEFYFDCEYQTWLQKTKQDYESRVESVFQDFFTMELAEVLGRDISVAKDTYLGKGIMQDIPSNSLFSDEGKHKNLPVYFENRLKDIKILLIGIHRKEIDQLKRMCEGIVNRQMKIITRQIKEKGEKHISAIKYDLYEKHRKAVAKMEEQLGDLMVDKMGKASAELVLQKMENEWKLQDEIEKKSEEGNRERTLQLQMEMEEKFESELETRIEAERKLLKEEYDIQKNILKKNFETVQETKLTSIVSELKKLHECELKKVRASYEQRLYEEVEISKHEIIRALEEQIQVLLAEDIDDVSHPKELVQLQEKFAAQYKKEIIFLKEQHSQEITKLRQELEKKHKDYISKHSFNIRNNSAEEKPENAEMETNELAENILVASNSEPSPPLHVKQLTKERVTLQKANALLKGLVYELTKYVCLCENTVNDAINKSFKLDFDDSKLKENKNLNYTSDSINASSGHEKIKTEEHNKSFSTVAEMATEYTEKNETLESNENQSLILSAPHPQFHFTPDISNILNLIEEQMFGGDAESDLDITLNLQAELNNCLKRLNAEANALMLLSCKVPRKKQDTGNGTKDFEEKLQSISKQLQEETKTKEALEVKLEKLQDQAEMLMVLQEEKQEAQRLKEHYSLELYAAHKRIMELEQDLGSKEMVTEGFGENTQSHLSRRLENMTHLQDRAKSILCENTLEVQNSPHLQLIEELCYEGDRLSEDARKEREDLQLQVEAADKQLRATRQFLEEQAAEREQERDDFLSDIAKLQDQLRERDRDLNEHNRLLKEIESLEEQLKEAMVQKMAAEVTKEELESELKAMNDKVWCLRDIIAELESQIQAKTQYETTLEQQLHELQKILEHQKANHQELVEELELLRTDSGKAELAEHISHLEEQLQKHRLHMEQFQSNSTAVRLMKAQLRELEATVDRKTKDLESLHAANSSASCSSPSEDVSIRDQLDATRCDTPEEVFVTHSPVCLPLDELHRLQDKLQRHTRAEEVALKKIRDLEMQLKNIKKNEEETIMEKDVLQTKVEEQILKISDLERRLNEHHFENHCLKKEMYNKLQSKFYIQEREIKEVKENLEIKESEVKELRDTLNQVRALAVTQEKEWNIKYVKEVESLLMLRDKCQALENEKQKLENLLEETQKRHTLYKEEKTLEQSELKTDPSCLMNSEQSLQSRASNLGNINVAIDVAESSKEMSALDGETSEKKDNLLHSSWASNMFDVHTKHYCEDSMLMDHVPSPEPILYYNAEQVDLHNHAYVNQLKAAVDQSLTKLEIYEGELNFLHNRVSEQEDLISKLNEEKFIAEKKVKTMEVSEEDLTKKLESLLLEYNALKQELDTLNNETVSKDCLVEKEANIAELQEQKTMLELNVTKLKNCIEELTQRVDSILDEKSQLNTELQLVKKERILLEEQLNEEKKNAERKVRELELSQRKLTKKTEALISKNDMLREQLQADKEDEILFASDELEEKVKKELEISAQLDTSLLQSISASSEDSECNTAEVQSSPDIEVAIHKAVHIGIGVLNPRELSCFIGHICTAASSIFFDNNTSTKFLEADEMRTFMNRVAALENTLIQTIEETKEKAAGIETFLYQEKKYVRQLSESLEKEHMKRSEMQNAMDVQTRAMLDLITEKDILLKEANSIEDRLEQYVVHLQQEKTRVSFLRQKLLEEEASALQLRLELNRERQRFKVDRQNDADCIEKLNLKLETASATEEKLRNELERERSILKADKTELEYKTEIESLQRQIEADQQKHASLELELKQAQEEIIQLHGKIEMAYNIHKHNLQIERYEKEQLQKEMISLTSQFTDVKNEVTNLQKLLSLKAAEMEALERKLSIARESELVRQKSNEAHQQQEKRHREALLIKQVKLRQKVYNLEEEVAMLKAERAGRQEVVTVDVSQNTSPQTKERTNCAEVSKDENVLLRQNIESVLLLARLTTERYELQQKINRLEDKLKKFSDLQDDATNGKATFKCPSVKSVAVGTETECKSIVTSSDMDMEERVKYLYGRYLRSESYRKALIWQKRYLLVVLGSYMEPKSKTISQLAQLSDYEEAKHQARTSDSRKAIGRFRSAALVVVAVSRMHYLVRRWRHGRRTGSTAVLNRIFTEAALDSAPTSYHGTRRRSSSISTHSWVGSQGHSAHGGHQRPSSEREHHSKPTEKKSMS